MKRLLMLVLYVLPFTNAFAQVAHVTALPVVENQLQVGKMTVNLPAGQWQVLNVSDFRTSVDNGSSGGQVERKYLVRINDKNQFEAAVFIAATKFSTNVSSWNDTVCQRKDTLWVQQLDGNFNFPACLFINHSTPFWTAVPTNEFDKTIFDWYRQNNVTLPKTALFTSYRKYFSGDFITVSYFTNPEVLGFTPDSGASWSASQWHPGVIKEDAAKVKYIDALKEWSRSIEASHRNSLMKGTSIGDKLAALPSLK